MSDLIRVVDLEVYTQIGLTEAERAQPQKLHISLDMFVDNVGQAALSDDIWLTVNYFEVTQRIKELLVRRKTTILLETLAEEIAADLLDNFAIEKITLEIKKFILPDARYVAVRIQRVKD